MFPEIVGPIADSLMIQRGGPEQTGQKDAQWLTSLGGSFAWTTNVFSALGFTPGQEHQADRCLTIAQTEDLPVLIEGQEIALALM